MIYEPEYLFDLEQGTPEWLDTRLGRLTGTDAYALIPKLSKKDAAFAVWEKGMSVNQVIEEVEKLYGAEKTATEATVKKYLTEFAKEYTPSSDDDLGSLLKEKCSDYLVGYEGPDISGQYWVSRGAEYEPLARSAFIANTFQSVDECGFITYGMFGGHSPDGLIGEDEMLEIKCPSGKVVIGLHEGDEISKSHYAQMMWGLAITGRKRCHYWVWHPKLKWYHCVIERDEKVIKQMLDRFHTWEDRLTSLIEKYQNNGMEP